MQIYSTGCSPSGSLTFSTAYAALSWDSYLEIGGQKIPLCFGEMRKHADGTALRRADFSGGYTEEHICFLKDSAEITLTVHNTSDQALPLDRIVLLSSSDLTLSTIPGPEWYLYRSGRLKNEMPAVCRLGDTGAAFSDARATLKESGGGTEEGVDAPLLISDSMTLLSGGADSPSQLLLTFETGDRMLVETRLTLRPDRTFESLESSCIANLLLPPGVALTSETLRISCPASPMDAIDAYALRKAERYHALKGNRVPSVYCTWYYYGLTVTEADVLENLKGLDDRSIPFDVFQIDEGWETSLGDWRANEKFPSGMAALADAIQRTGRTPGIWTSPFIAHESAPIMQEHPEWFLKHPDGSWCLFPMNGTIYRVLDITNEDAVAWAADLYRQLREWGYRYHKLDFTRAAVLYPDAPRHRMDIPIAQAYRNAVLALRREMGEDAYFLMCGGLYDPLIGIVNAQRTGSDVLSMWSVRTGKGGKTAPFTIKQNLLRYWMNPWWDADPDALMVRRQKEMRNGLNLSLGLLNDAEVQTSVLNQFMGCGLVCSTEPMKTIEDDRLLALRHVLPPLPGVPHPRYLWDGSRYPFCVDLTYPDYHMVVRINWSDTETIPCAITLDKELLGDFCESAERFTVCSFWDQTWTCGVSRGDTVTLGSIPPHGAAMLKILPDTSAPAVLSSTSHFSMGAELSDLTIHEDVLHMDLDYGFRCPVRYTVRLPEGLHPASLPEGVSSFRGLLEFYIPDAGHYEFRVPLSRF